MGTGSACPFLLPMSALQENACLKRMTPSPDASDAAVIEAFAGLPGQLEQAPALMARVRALDCQWQGGPGVFKGDLYFYRVNGDLRGRVGKIDTGACPLYLLTGEYDFSCTPEDTRRTAAAIDGASVTIMEQLGHFPMSENPGPFRRYIAPVLSEILKHSTTLTKQGAHV